MFCDENTILMIEIKIKFTNKSIKYAYFEFYIIVIAEIIVN